MTDYALALQLYYNGGYNTVSASRIAAAGIGYSRGVTDELDLQKGTLSCRIFDADDVYRPSNPASALYGIVGAYLPMRYRIDGVNRFAGEIEQLGPAQTDDHHETAGVTDRGSRWVDFKASGPLGTVGRWRDTIASPLYAQIQSLSTMRAYWPGEDGSDAVVMSSAYAGVEPAVVSGVTFANADGPAGSNKLLVIGSAGQLNGKVPRGISTTAWQVQWTTNLNGADGTERQAFAWRTSNGYWWVWQASLTTYRIVVIDNLGNTLFSSSSLNGGVAPGDNIVFRIKCSKSGSTWTVEPGWYEENSPVLTGFTDTFVGTAGAPLQWITGANTVMNGAYFGHLFFTDGVGESLQDYAMLSAINGYPGESTSDRYSRVLDGRGIPLEVLGDTSKATLMGPQRPATVKAQLQEIQRTEQGLIFESPDGRGLRLALRHYLYEQANDPALTLTYPADIGPGFQELATTLELYNTVIAQDRSGISAVAQEPNGRYGTAAPPTGSGLVDKTVDVNLSRADLVPQVASAYLRYFQQVQRFAEITIDLDKNPGLRTAAEAVDVGMFIQLQGKTPDPVLLLVVRVGAKDQLKRHVITFETVPGGVFSTGTWGGDRRWDLATCTLSAGVTSSATALTLTMTKNESWSTVDEPYDLMIAGERVTVTTMNARTGSGPYTQTCTVTRHVNGVTKALAAGEPVHIAKGGVWGW